MSPLVTTPGGKEVSRVSVRVVPNTAKIPGELKTALERIEKTFDLEIPVSLDTSGVLADARRLAALAEAEAQVQLRTILDMAGVDAQVAQERARQERSAPIELPTELGDPPKKDIPPVTVPVRVDDPIDAAFQSKIRADLRKLGTTLNLNVPAGVEGEVLRRQVAAQIKSVEKSLSVQVPTEPGAAAEYRRKLADQVRLVERAVQATVPVELDVDAAEQEKVERQVEGVKRRAGRSPIRIPLDIDPSSLTGISAQVAKLGALLSAGGLGALGGQAAAGGIVALGAAVAQAAGAIALLPAAGAAAATVMGTLTLGLQGVSDALTEDDPKKYAEALEKLSPAARKTVVALRELAPEFRDLRSAVQDRLFAGMATEVRELGERYLPVLRAGLTSVAEELNEAGRELAGFAKQRSAVQDVASIFAATSQSTGRLTEALVPLAGALLDIAAVGSQFLAPIATELAAVAAGFGASISVARESGELQRWIAEGIAAVKAFGSVLGNLGSIIAGVFRAGDAAGAGFLGTLDSITARVADLVNSSEGQEALGAFLGAAADAAQVLLPVLSSVARLIGNTLAPLLADVGEAVGPGVVRFLDGLEEALHNAGPGITEFAEGFSSLVSSLGGALPSLGDLVGVLGSELGGVLRDIGPDLAELATVLAGELAEALPVLAPAVGDFVRGLSDLLVAASPLIPVLAEVAKSGLTVLAAAAERLAPIVADLAEGIGEALLPVLPDLVDAFLDLVDALAPVADELAGALVDALRILAPLLPGLVRSVTKLVEVVTPLVEIIADLITGFADFTEQLNGFIDSGSKLGSAVGDGFRAGFEAAVPGIGPFVGLFEQLNEVANGGVGEFTNTTARIPGAWYEAAQNMDEGTTFIGATLDTVQSLFGTAFAGLYATAEAGSASVLSTVDQRSQAMRDAILGPLGAAVDGVTGLWGVLTGNTASAFDTVEAEIAGSSFSAAQSANRSWLEIVVGARSGFDATQREVASGIQRAGSTASGLPGIVRDAIGPLGGYLTGSGRSLIQGFIDGLGASDLIGRAVSAARAVVSAVSGLFPSSPAKEGPFSGKGWTPFRGAALVEGFAEGMTKSVWSARRAALSVTSAVADQFTGTLPASFSGEAVAGATFNVYPREAQSETSIARAMVRELAITSRGL